MSEERERFELDEDRGRIAYEHFHRYSICSEYVGGKRVLDLACGTGYGSFILASAASEVVGVDLSATAIRQASKRYARPNTKFMIADCFDLPFDANTFDVVVANELIEHIEDHDGLIREAKRVLVDGGLFLVSTPNKPVYNQYKPANPFHVSEMEVPEFRRLLSSHFGHVHCTGLRMALVSAGFDLDGDTLGSDLASAKIYHGYLSDKDGTEVESAELELEYPEYILATCSDEPIEAVRSRSSLFYSRDSDLWMEHEKIMSWASHLHEEDEDLRADLVRTRSDADQSRVAREAAERESNDLKDRLSDTRHSAEIAVRALDQLREALTRESALTLQTSSRLLSQMLSAPVEADQVSLVEALFKLNESRASQRMQLDAAHARNAEREAALTAARHELIDREAQLTDLRDHHAEATADLVERAGQQVELERQLAIVRREAVDREAQLTDLRDHRAKAAADLAERAAQQVELERQLAIARREAVDHEAQLAELRAQRAQAAEVDSRAQTTLNRRRARFASKHRRIQEQLSRANAAVRNRAPLAAPVSPRNWVDRLKLRPRRFKTMLFDPGWIERQYPDLGKVTLDRYQKTPSLYRLDPHPLFAAGAYLDRYPDVAGSGISPLEHYVRHGWREGRDPHHYFSNDWYLHHNPDVMEQGQLSPLEHYLEHGWREGRRPNPVFDPQAYLERYPDVAAAGFEPLTHYVVHGAAELREVAFGGDEVDWRSLAPGAGADSLIDYLLTFPPADVGAGTAPSGVPAASSSPQQRQEVVGASEEWPPIPIDDYWLPQTLRDLIVEADGAKFLPLYGYLCSVMEAYRDDPERFPKSQACRDIVARARSLAVSKAGTDDGSPDVSIVIPVYNNIIDTLLCIVSILEMEAKASYEIIVADDGSSDATSLLVPQIDGIVRHLRQPRNFGFLGNCNAAARTARGSILVFLNNDTLVMPGWLDGLLAPFEQNDGTGLVGSKLISWDGTLQEAGGILWEDGSAWNFGRGQDALAPEYNYLKDVDYCSGASIAIPMALWQQLSGFDPLFEPAYCEDADLAFRIRAAGYRTLYSPQSEVIHHEGRSHGRDTNSGVKAHQLTNQQRFVERWGEVLAREHFPNAQNVLKARDRSSGKKHVLVIDHYVPQWDRDAGSRTMLHFLEALLAEGCAVTFWPDNLHYDRIYAPRLQAMGIEILFGAAYAGNFEQFLRERAGLYDLALLSRPHVADKYIDALIRLSDTKLIYYGHDLHFKRLEMQRAATDEAIHDSTIEAMKSAEIAICSASDVVLYPDPEEAKLMQSLVGESTRCMPVPAYCYDKTQFATAAKTVRLIAGSDRALINLLFVGGFSHEPNRDGISWFCREVAPSLRSSGVNFKLRIAGSNITPDVMALEADDVEILGFVSDADLKKLYREASAVIAPLRFGAGVKGKVIEAMAHGVPVITTDVGAQGIDCAANCLFVANHAADFAKAVEQAADAAHAGRKASAALDYVRKTYSKEALGAAFRGVLTARAARYQA